MPHPVKATFETTPTKFPSTVVPAGFLLTLTQLAAESPELDKTNLLSTTLETVKLPAKFTGTCAMDESEITIADVPAGTYTGHIALVDAAGAEVAPGVDDPAPITVLDDQPVTFPVPTSLTLTLP